MINKNYHIITHELELDRAIKHIEESECLAFDTETTGLNVRKDKVVGMSFSGTEGEAYYIVKYKWDVKNEELVQLISDETFMKVLNMLADKELIMWNASYDVRIVKNDLGVDLMPSLVTDAMLMKHTIEEDGKFKLKETAIELQEFLGMDMETAANEEQIEMKANVAKNGGSTTQKNFEMYKADIDVLGKYACADADLTLRIANYYLDKLEKEELEEFFFDVEPMPLYKEVTVKMEEKGIHLDMDLILQTQKEIEIDIADLNKQVIDQIIDTPEGQAWYKEMLDNKYPAKKGGTFGQGVVEFYELFNLPKTASGKYSLTVKNVDKFGGSCDGSNFLRGTGELSPEVAFEIQKKIHESKGPKINISSKPQLSAIVFDHMGVKPLSKTKGGKPQFNDTVIQHLEELGYEWAKTLGNYNKLIKIKGTYIERFLDAQENGIYYPSFFQHRTISGRYGSDMQQLPRPKEEGELDPIILRYNNLIRAFFIAGPDRAFIDNDYESLEPHVFAHVSGDEGLKNIFRKGHDFYSTIAIATEGLEGVSADKKAPNYLGAVDKPVRQAAKAYALGVPYGMKGYALGKTLEVSTEEAEGLIEGYLSGFPELRNWMDRSEHKAIGEGYVSSEIGRVRHLPKIKKLYKVHGEKLLDYKYRASMIRRNTARLGKEEAEKYVNGLYLDYKNGLNNAKNFQIQSLSASIVNLAAIEINRELIKRNIDGWVALQIHDQLVVNVPKENAEECRELVQDIMENNYKISIPLKAPAEVSENLLEGH
jgi:DNA polymerase I-like protein with 3'-5' exonuclease and polymerase domains